MLEETTRAIREEIVRQYRDDDRGRCPAGAHYYEEHIGPHLIAIKALASLPDKNEALHAQLKKQGETILQYRKLFMSLLDAKQKRYEMNSANAIPPHQIETVNIEKEEYDRWRKVRQIIDDATYKD